MVLGVLDQAQQLPIVKYSLHHRQNKFSMASLTEDNAEVASLAPPVLSIIPHDFSYAKSSKAKELLQKW